MNPKFCSTDEEGKLKADTKYKLIIKKKMMLIVYIFDFMITPYG